MIVGLLHPGAMGAALGASLVAAGHDVTWDPAGRSPATAERAAAAGLRSVSGGLPELVGEADLIVSVCPPHGAVDLANEVAGTGRLGGTTYLDANAVSPATAAQVAAIVEEVGATYVDGGVIGLPPRPGRPCRIYLSGPAAAELAPTLAHPATGLEVGVVGVSPTAASALKMVYAAWNKATGALVLAIRAVARAEGVDDALVAEWARSAPAPLEASPSAARSTIEKGWRWVAEMEEIAATFARAGLPDGFHSAAAEVYRAFPREGGGGGDPLEAALDRLRRT